MRPTLRHAVETVLVLLGVAVVLLGGAVWRLARGPVPVGFLTPMIERNLAEQVHGGRAHVGAVGVVWYGAAQALGVQLDDVSVVDPQGRPVLQAKHVQAAVALDSILYFSPAPGKISITDFFVAISVSPQGRYELGYDAKGPPDKAAGGLAQIFQALTGPARRAHPVSFLRDLELDRGVMTLRQTDGSLAWTGRVRQVAFHKIGGMITVVGDSTIGDADQAVLKVQAKAAVGLKDAFVEGTVENLNPSRIFPSAGPTRPLSALDALVQGHGSLDYSASTGVRAADVAFTAGAGGLRFGQSHQRFDSANVRAAYDPETGDVELQSVKLAAERARLDVNGRIHLTPEGAGKPARLEFALQGPEAVVAFTAAAPPQRLTDLSAKGRYTPEIGRLEIDQGGAVLGHAPISAKGVVFRGEHENSGWGAKLEAQLGGSIDQKDLFTFWPEDLAGTAREWLGRELHAARISNVDFKLDLPPGAHELTNEMLRLSFDAAGVQMSITADMPMIEDGVASGVLLGNRFDLTLKSGRMNTVALSEGSVEIPQLHPKGARAVFKARAIGDAQAILDIVDTKPTRLISTSGFDIKRVSGQGDVKLEITRPMLSDVPLRDYTFAYKGVIHNAGLLEAALGFNLKNGELVVDGAGNRLSLHGPALVGPYRGDILFQEVFTSPARSTVDLNGAIDLATIGLSGPAGSAAPLVGHFTVQNNAGEGVLKSRAFDGQVSWRDGDHGDVVLRGSGDTALWRSVGLPLGAGVPDRLPLRLSLKNSPAGWSGRLEADAYSGSVLFTPGPEPRLRYATDLTPADARKLGLGGLPLFERTQSLVLDASLGGADQGVAYSVANLSGRIGWAANDGRTTYHLKTVLSADDVQSLGLAGVINPPGPVPVDATLVNGPAGMTGQADVGGQVLRYTVSPPVNGRKSVALSANLDADGLVRLGLAAPGSIKGAATLSGRLDLDPVGLASGRIDLDLTGAAIALQDTEWRKPAGQAARAYAEFARHGDGLDFNRIFAEGPGLAIDAHAAIAGGRLASLQTRTARLEGLFDGEVRAADDHGRTAWFVRGRYFDARRWIKSNSSRTKAGAASGGPPPANAAPIHIDAALDEVRVNRTGRLKAVKVEGDWGAPGAELDLSATTERGASISGALTGDRNNAGFTLHTSNVSDVSQTLFGLTSLRGGEGTASGRLLPGGADITLQLKTVRVARVPALAQILTVASLQGLADTLNGGGIEFAEVVAPIRLRGSQLTLDHARATGPALGITAQGVMDLDADTMDLTGAVAPAYGLNSFLGGAPLVGRLLTSRKGEGVVGLTYSAKGATAAPRVLVNPLSIATPGILRRIFEGMPASAPPAKPAPKR